LATKQRKEEVSDDFKAALLLLVIFYWTFNYKEIL